MISKQYLIFFFFLSLTVANLVVNINVLVFRGFKIKFSDINRDLSQKAKTKECVCSLKGEIQGKISL